MTSLTEQENDMSNLRHMSDEELVKVIRYEYKLRLKLAADTILAPTHIKGRLQGRINNSEIVTHWAIKYLTSPYKVGDKE